jgi:hypothetical protein
VAGLLDRIELTQPRMTPELRGQMSRLVSPARPGQAHARAPSPPAARVASSLLNPSHLPSQTVSATAAALAATTAAKAVLPASAPAKLSAFVPSFVELMARIREDLEANLSRLLSLNTSRREAVAQHLDRLAGFPKGPGTSTGDAAGGLRRWIDSARTPAQTAALSLFFEEIARTLLGQAILLKAWSDRGIRPWKREDLGCLNWALSQALKPKLPIDREGWQITKNLYSWYVPSPALQNQIWSALETWRIRDEGPEFLAGLLRAGSSSPAGHSADPQGYDERFFGALWEQLPSFGFTPVSENDPLRRRRTVFSPTLRDGAMVRTGPASVVWVGLEAHPFQLLVAELVQLWWGPSAPPVWAQGTGLEVHPRDQLSLALVSPKVSLLSRIQDMESADLAIVLEERTTRSNGRSGEASRFRELLDSLPYFKKLRAPATSLGDLQACIALTKLRPGGMLLWAREEPLAAADGPEVLRFLLDRGQLLCEWDFTEITHSLPVSIPLFPKHLYLLRREPEVQARSSHRPVRINIHGQIRSHVELPLLVSDALARGSAAMRGDSGGRQLAPRGQWSVHLQQSPSTQREWAERWPDPSSLDTIRALEELRTLSAPLAAVTTIRLTPTGDSERGGAWSVAPALKGLWIRAEFENGTRRLKAEPLPRPGREAHSQGFLVLVSDEGWIAPLTAYLQGETVRRWLEHHAERKGERWVLSEQVVKFIPVPKLILEALGAQLEGIAREEGRFALPLPGEWEKLAAEVAYRPKLVIERVASLARNEEGRRIRAELFVRASRAAEHLRESQARLLSMVYGDGRIRWRDLLEVLPRTELVSMTLHPGVRVHGSLPSQVPIGRFERVKTPSSGILLTTEAGFHLHLGMENPRLLEMVWEQLEGVLHPTWAELVNYLRLPRNLELAEATASDVLRSHGEQSMKLAELGELLSACSDL